MKLKMHKLVENKNGTESRTVYKKTSHNRRWG